MAAQIPYPLVDLLTWKGVTDIGVTILLKCRNFNVYYLGIPRELDAIAVYQSLVNLLPGVARARHIAQSRWQR